MIGHTVEKRLKEKKPSVFKCLVYPIEPDVYGWGGGEKRITQPPGIIPDLDIKMELVDMRNGFGQKELVLSFKNKEGNEFRVTHNYSGYFGNAKKYTNLRSLSGLGRDQKIELFVDVTKKELKEAEDKHFNR